MLDHPLCSRKGGSDSCTVLGSSWCLFRPSCKFTIKCFGLSQPNLCCATPNPAVLKQLYHLHCPAVWPHHRQKAALQHSWSPKPSSRKVPRAAIVAAALLCTGHSKQTALFRIKTKLVQY